MKQHFVLHRKLKVLPLKSARLFHIYQLWSIDVRRAEQVEKEVDDLGYMWPALDR